MKIAVASEDGGAVSSHFGRCRCFVVFETADGRITGRETRAREGAGCGGEHGHHDPSHTHAGLVTLLEDCSAVLCGGMGWRAAEELKTHGIEPVILAEAMAPEEAARAFLDGTLRAAEGFCRGHE